MDDPGSGGTPCKPDLEARTHRPVIRERMGLVSSRRNNYGSPEGWWRRWAAIVIIAVAFVVSLAAQAWFMRDDPQTDFWAAVFENWQSEFLQLVVQGVLLLAWRDKLFRADYDDHEELVGKLDFLMREVEALRRGASDCGGVDCGSSSRGDSV